jgi:hypothetical protein
MLLTELAFRKVLCAFLLMFPRSSKENGKTAHFLGNKANRRRTTALLARTARKHIPDVINEERCADSSVLIGHW